MMKERILIRGGRVYDHDSDVDFPKVADLAISGGGASNRLELRRQESGIASLTPAGSSCCRASSIPTIMRMTRS
jgi:hypothetical protein